MDLLVRPDHNPHTVARLVRRALPGLTALAVAGPLAQALPVHAASGDCTTTGATTSCTYTFTATAQTWTVPLGVTRATFDVFGAQGGNNCRNIDGGLNLAR